MDEKEKKKKIKRILDRSSEIHLASQEPDRSGEIKFKKEKPKELQEYEEQLRKAQRAARDKGLTK